MDPLLKKVKDIYVEGCVSIIMNTTLHKTQQSKRPD